MSATTPKGFRNSPTGLSKEYMKVLVLFLTVNYRVKAQNCSSNVLLFRECLSTAVVLFIVSFYEVWILHVPRRFISHLHSSEDPK